MVHMKCLALAWNIVCKLPINNGLQVVKDSDFRNHGIK